MVHRIWTVYLKIEAFNPYRQIPETISKKRAVTQGISRKLFPDFFQILQFWGVTQTRESQGIFRKLFPGKGSSPSGPLFLKKRSNQPGY